MNNEPFLFLSDLISMDQLDAAKVTALLDKANIFLHDYVEKNRISDRLHGHIVTNLFFEPSTRTLNSFEIAAKRLGAIVQSPDLNRSSTQKGESLIDTIKTFYSLGSSAIVIRHSENNTAQFVKEALPKASILNAGDGSNEHPTQALLDLLTIRQEKKQFDAVSVAIIGDIKHSRTAHSLIKGLTLMGCKDIRLIGPQEFLPDSSDNSSLHTTTNLSQGLEDVDVIYTFRIQKERLQQNNSTINDTYPKEYCIDENKIALAKSDAVLLHPGPMNRGIEISSTIADSHRALINRQVRNGVAVRMAVLDTIILR